MVQDPKKRERLSIVTEEPGPGNAMHREVGAIQIVVCLLKQPFEQVVFWDDKFRECHRLFRVCLQRLALSALVELREQKLKASYPHARMLIVELHPFGFAVLPLDGPIPSFDSSAKILFSNAPLSC